MLVVRYELKNKKPKGKEAAKAEATQRDKSKYGSPGAVKGAAKGSGSVKLDASGKPFGAEAMGGNASVVHYEPRGKATQPESSQEVPGADFIHCDQSKCEEYLRQVDGKSVLVTDAWAEEISKLPEPGVRPWTPKEQQISDNAKSWFTKRDAFAGQYETRFKDCERGLMKAIAACSEAIDWASEHETDCEKSADTLNKLTGRTLKVRDQKPKDNGGGLFSFNLGGGGGVLLGAAFLGGFLLLRK